MGKSAFITGITGQDGSYLAEFLINKGYRVYGLVRRTSTLQRERLKHLADKKQITLCYGDMTETESLGRLIRDIEPDEVYNLAAQSHVGISFENPKYTTDVNATGTLRLLEAIRQTPFFEKVHYYQASTSELFGLTTCSPQNETTPFHPRSPYAVSKLHAYWSAVNYREAHDMFTCNGILFNHESPRRGENFVTRKITQGVARIVLGMGDALNLGNLNSKRDWGHARDYIEGMWLMMQHNCADDYVLATGECYTIRDFASLAFQLAGIEIYWQGEGPEEQGIVSEINRDIPLYQLPGLEAPVLENVRPGDVVVAVDPRFFRPAEVYALVGDAAKAKQVLGWKPKVGIRELVKEMLEYDIITESGNSGVQQYVQV